jgi:uncharacterized protein (TIGR03000 family)
MILCTAASLVMAAWAEPAQAQRRAGGYGGNYGGNYRPNGGYNWGNYANYGWSGYSTNYYGYGYNSPSYNYGYYPNNYGYGYSYPRNYSYNYPNYNYGYSNYNYSYPNYTYSYPNYSSSYGSIPNSNNIVYNSSSPQYSTSNYGNENAGHQVQVRVILPDPNARLWVQDQMNQFSGNERLIVSPPAALDPNMNYSYTMKATWMENGKEVNQEKKIDVRAGQQYVVDFGQGTTNNAGPISSNSASNSSTPQYSTSNYGNTQFTGSQVRIRVILPDPNARLWVQDQLNQGVGTERFVTSPGLDPNTNYTYTIKASWMENGQEVTHEKKIDVRAGQEYTVDFNQRT